MGGSRPAIARGGQYASALMTSPPARVPRLHQMFRAIESLMNRAEPSPISTFTPPGWALLAPMVKLLSDRILLRLSNRQPLKMSLGFWMVLKRVKPGTPHTQR